MSESNKCCPFNYYYDTTNTVCAPISSLTSDTSKNNCRFIKGSSNTDCIDIRTDTTIASQFSNEEPCLNSKYLTNKRCCSEGDMYLSGASCTSILTTTGFLFPAACLRVDYDSKKCTKCSNYTTHYISTAACCPYN